MQIILMLEISELRNSSSIKNKKNILKKQFCSSYKPDKTRHFCLLQKILSDRFFRFFFYEQFSLPTKQNRELLCYAARLHENKAKFSK